MSNHVAVRKMLNYLLQSYEIKQIQFNFFFVFYHYTVHFAIYKVHTPTNALFIKLDKVLKFTLKSL